MNLETSPHWVGADYKNISSPQLVMNQAFIAENTIPISADILDIGCGNGQTSKLLAGKASAGSLLGVDASESMIKAAQNDYSSGTIKFEVLNAQSLNFENTFDLVTCFFCMQWVQDKPLTFKAIYRALRNKGQFLMAAPRPHPHLPGIRNTLMDKPSWAPYFGGYTDPLQYIVDCEYDQYAKDAGFDVKTYRTDRIPVYFQDYESFFKFMAQMTPHLSRLPTQEKKDEFLHSLLEQYVSFYPKLDDGTYVLYFDLIKLGVLRSDA